MEHYEISEYRTARALPEAIGNNAVAEILKTTEDEEDATDKKLTTTAGTSVPLLHSNHD